MTEVEPRPTTRRLAALRVDELRALAASLGIRHVATMRKGPLVDAITERTDTQPTDSDVREADTDQTGTTPEQQVDDSIPTPDEPTLPDAPEPTPDEPQPAAPEAVTPAEDAVDEAGGGAEAADAAPEPADEDAAAVADGEQAPAEEQQAPAAEPTAPSPDEAAGGAEAPDSTADQVGSGDPKPAADHVNAGLTGIAEDLEELQRQGTGETEEGEGERTGGRRGRGRGRGRGQSAQQAGQGQPTQGGQGQNGQGQSNQNGQTGQNQGGQSAQPAEAAPAQQGAQQAQDGEGRRGRYRDRKRRTGGEWDEPEVRDDDVLIPIAGILDVLENYAFVRTSGYLSGQNDVYVSLGQVKKYHLRRGDAVVGSIRQVPDGEQQGRQKYNALVKVDSINGLPVADAENRVEFEKLTPLYPQERLRLETDSQKISTRVVDLVAPVGKGQRGLIVAPRRSGRTLLLQAIANAITKNNPEAHLMVVLVDERPEEVTEMQRTVKGEVIASTFDRSAEDHTTVAELAIDRAKRLVELGYDVVVLIDSITRLTRAFAQTAPQAGRALDGGLDTGALAAPKQLFGAARNVENGGSLTVIATAITETGSAVDAAVLEEFRGAANMELVLSSALADKRIFPAVDVTASGTLRDEQLLGPDEVKVTRQLRRALAGREPQEALETVVSKLRETGTNVEFLIQMQKSLPAAK